MEKLIWTLSQIFVVNRPQKINTVMPALSFYILVVIYLIRNMGSRLCTSTIFGYYEYSLR
jgi:hypothetical protein